MITAPFGGVEGVRNILKNLPAPQSATQEVKLVINDDGSYEIPGLVTSAVTEGTTRDHPLDDEYVAKLATAVSKIPGLTAEYFSAGQDADCNGSDVAGSCVGSTRHNVEEDGYGRTADVKLYLNGELLLPGNPEHKEVIAEFISTAVGLGIDEVGIDARSGNSMIHLGYNNTPAAWGYGPDGSGKNIYLDEVYRDAYNEGTRTQYAGPLITEDGGVHLITTTSTQGSNPYLDLFNSLFPEERQVTQTQDTPKTEEAVTTPSGTITTDKELNEAVTSIPGKIAEVAVGIVKTITDLFTGGTNTSTSPSISDSLVSNNGSSNESNSNRNTDGLLTINDIQKVIIHTGVELECPNLQGISQNGYIYTISFTNSNEILRREGCGIGMPNIFAQAIADDLNRTGLFKAIAGSQLIPKMEFKVYKPLTN